MTTVIDHLRRGYRTIRLALAEADYARFMSDGEFARAQLDQRYSRRPELFPEVWGRGYAWCGFTEPSRQQEGLRCRRVRLTAGEGVFAVAPAWVMPYLTASVAEVEKARLLMRFQVPCWALAQVFGRDALFGYRLEQSLGRFSVVGTTVKAPERLPQDLVADEKHRRLDGEKIDITTTAGEGCILGASVADSASETALRPADGVLAEEARAVAADSTPATVH